MFVYLSKDRLKRFKQYEEAHSQELTDLIVALEKNLANAVSEREKEILRNDYKIIWEQTSWDPAHLGLSVDELASLDCFRDEIFEQLDMEPDGLLLFADIVGKFVRSETKDKKKNLIEMRQYIAVLNRNLGFARRRICGSPVWFPYTIIRHIQLTLFKRAMTSQINKALDKIRY